MDPTNDIGAKAWDWQSVTKIFRSAFLVLHKGAALNSVIKISHEMVESKKQIEQYFIESQKHTVRSVKRPHNVEVDPRPQKRPKT